MPDTPDPLDPPAFLTRRLALGAAAIIACVAALVTLAAYQSRQQYEESARIATQNLSKTLEAAIAGQLGKADLALLHLIDEYQRQRADGKINRDSMQVMMREESRHHPYLEDMRLADAQGNIFLDGDIRKGQRVSLADRDYFQRLRQNPGQGLVLSMPLRSRINNKLVVVLARAISSAEDNFSGIALVIMTVEQLARGLGELDVGAHGYTALRGDNLGLIARHPEDAQSVAMVGNTLVSAELRAAVQAGKQAGSFVTTTPYDHIERSASYRRVGDYPMHVVVGLAEQDYLREWRVETLINGLLATALCALTLLLTRLLHLSRQRELAAMEILSKQARSDFLTELNNRRCFIELADAELARSIRYGGAVSLLMMDIDRFKSINDRYGHKSGDLVLKALAGMFRETLREVDICGRLGGEEFAILLPATDGDHAREVAERLRLLIASRQVTIDHGQVTHFTVSIGVATLGSSRDSIDSLLSCADRAMYEAKQTGRNRVCSA